MKRQRFLKLSPWSFCMLPVTYIITYVMAASKENWNYLPYISYTAVLPPESCIFSQAMNIMAFVGKLGFTVFSFGALGVWLQYLQTKELLRVFPMLSSSSVRCSHKLSLYFGSLMTIGAHIVANYQVTLIRTVHRLGASCFFGFGFLYFLMLTILSWSLRPIISSVCVCIFRIILVVLIFTDFIIMTTETVKSVHLTSVLKYKTKNDTSYNHLLMQRDFSDLITVCGEWIAMISFCLFIFSLSHELNYITFIPPKITVKERKNPGSQIDQ